MTGITLKKEIILKMPHKNKLFFLFISNLLMFFYPKLEGNSLKENPCIIPTYLYKILIQDDWEESQKKEKLILSPADDEFIHLSEEHQVNRIIEKFFKKNGKVVVLKINVSSLEGKLVKEANLGGTNKYFHLYNGFIPFKAIQSFEVISLRH